MARKSGSLPELKFHAPTKQHCVYLKGERVPLGRDEAEAKRKYDIIIAGLVGSRPDQSAGVDGPVTPAPAPAAPLSVNEALLRYWGHAERKYGNGTGQLERVAYALDAVRAVCGTEPADSFRGPSLKRVRAYLLRRPSNRTPRLKVKNKRRREPDSKAGQKLSRNYVNSLVGCVQTAWAWLVSEDLVPAPNLEALRAVKSLAAGEGGRETVRVTPPDEWAVEATLGECSPTVRAMVEVQRAAGCRPGELVRMRRRDISISPSERILLPNTRRKVSAVPVALDDGTPFVVWLYVPPAHKTSHKGKPRAVALGPKAQAALAPLVAECEPDDYLFRPADSVAWAEQKVGHKLPGVRPGPRYSTKSYAAAVGYAIGRCNKKRSIAGEVTGRALEPVPHWAPNQLRHHTATEIGEQFDDATVAAVLGHSGTDLVGLYAEQAIRKAAEAAAKAG